MTILSLIKYYISTNMTLNYKMKTIFLTLLLWQNYKYITISSIIILHI